MSATLTNTASQPNVGHLSARGDLRRLEAGGVPFDAHAWPELCETYRKGLTDPEKLRAYNASGIRFWTAKAVEGRLHPAWDGSAWTSRIHSRKPSVQGIPKGILRTAVKAPGSLIITADWSASHFRLLAHHSGDAQLKADLNHPDLYGEIAKAMGLDRVEDRKRIKVALLAMINGQGQKSRQALIPEDRGNLEHGFRTRWPVAHAFLEDLKEKAKANGWELKTPDGTVVHMPHAAYKAPAGFLQAVEADAMRRAMVLAAKLEDLLPLKLIMVVHDETVWEVTDPTRVDELVGVVQAVMEEALHIDAELTAGSVSVSWGPSWGDQDGSVMPPSPSTEDEPEEGFTVAEEVTLLVGPDPGWVQDAVHPEHDPLTQSDPLNEADGEFGQLHEEYWVNNVGGPKLHGMLEDVDGFLREVCRSVGPSSGMDENVRMSISKGGVDTHSDKTGDNKGSTTEASLLVNSWDTRGTCCPRGPWVHDSSGSSVDSIRLPCWGYGCAVCGRRMLHGLRASAQVILRRMTADDGWQAGKVEIPSRSPSGTMNRALHRWQDGHTTRHHFGIGTTPDSCIYLILWQGQGNRPKGALSRHLTALSMVEVTKPIQEVVDAMVASVDLPVWEGEGRVTLLRGSRALKSKIATLQSRVVGRSQAEEREDTPERERVVTYTGAKATRMEAEERAQATTQTQEEDTNYRSGAFRQTWDFKDQTPTTPIMREMKTSGFFDIVTQRGRAWTGFVELAFGEPATTMQRNAS